jgi:hypothetical protein
VGPHGPIIFITFLCVADMCPVGFIITLDQLLSKRHVGRRPSEWSAM